MANVIIKSEERQEAEHYAAHCFGIGESATAEQKEAVEVISRRTEEAAALGRQMERR